ncbi:MAG: LamG domain-containing protein, partial [Patescibacteria group bacterium]
MKKSSAGNGFSTKKNLSCKMFAFLFTFFIFVGSVIYSTPTIASADIVTGLKAHYKFDEGSGTIANDSSGTNNNGTISGGAVFGAGKIGQMINFDGVNDYVNVANNTTLNPTGDMTISAWVRFDQLGAEVGRYQKIIYKGHNVTPWESYELMMDENNQIIFTRAGGASSYAGAGYTGAVSKGAWYHIVGVSSGASMKIYVNGVDSTGWSYNNVSGSFLQSSNMDLRIGNSPWNSEYLKGAADDVRIYNRALTAAEVNELYNYTGVGSSSSAVSATYSPPQNFGVGISFATPNDPAALLYWTATTGGTYPLINYEAENLGEWGPISVSTTTLNYTDENVLNGTYYIFEVKSVYRDPVSGNIYKSEPASILIRVPTADECNCEIWKHCPYVTDVATYKYAVDFMSQLQMPPGTATTSVVSTSIPSGDYRVKIVSAFKNSVDTIDTNLNSKWYIKLTNGAAQVAVTSPSSNFSDIDSYPYYAFKNEIVNQSLSIPATTGVQGEWTGSSSVYSSSPTYNYINAVCAYFEKIDPATGLPYTSGSSGAVSIDSFTATPSPINSGSTTVLSWTSTNADYCTASGGWSGFKNLSGSTTTLPIYGTTIFGLKCVSGDASSEITKSVTVNINSSANTITSVNCQPSPKIANIGQQITWTVSPIPFSGLY